MATTTLHGARDHRALGAFLKEIRAARVPDTAGARTARRRVRGMRREEVALAAGISVTWYTWIEQGRPVSCSRETLHRLATALRMDRVERRHLFALAEPTNDVHPDPAASVVPDELARFVDAMRYEPAYVIDPLWNVLHQNRAAHAVLGFFESTHPDRGNVLRRLFLDPSWRTGFEGWDDVARSAVAQFRSATAALQRTDALTRFVADLAGESAEFRALWERRRLAASPVKQKTFHHPTAGAVAMHYAALRAGDDAHDVTVVVYAPLHESFDKVRGLVERDAAGCGG